MLQVRNSGSTKAVVTKHPSQNYFIYLLLTKNNIPEFAKKYDLPEVPLGYVEHLKKTLLEEPKDFDPKNRYHKPSLEYIKKLGIYNLFFPDKFTKEAMSYLTDLEVRTHIEEMLLGRTKPQDIAIAINTKLDSLSTEEGIDRYRHYFWNTKLLKIEDWNKLLDNPSARGRTKRLITGGPSYAKYHLGGFQQKVEAKQLLSDILVTLKHDLDTIKHMSPSESKIKMLSSSVGMISDIDDKLSTMDITMKDILKQFEKFKVDHIKANIQSIDSTAELGNYLGSGINDLPEVLNTRILSEDGHAVINVEIDEDIDEHSNN